MKNKTGTTMKRLFCTLLAMATLLPAMAQSNSAVRLALVIQEASAAAAADVLTVELSKSSELQLLERADIERAYREQSLSAGNRDYLKLGQILGADGVLLLTAIKADTNQFPGALPSLGANPLQGTNQFLGVQLIAVKPGVLLASERFSWPVDLSQWAAGFASHLRPLLPKLSVLVQNAVPISVVNLRAAVQSPETREVERLLTTLAIERLSRERHLFVLERRNLELLTAEKELQGLDDSSFWKGSYLLDGTLDRQGYARDTVTLSARLVPPQGGAPLLLEISGSRTNLAEVANRLADQLLATLQLQGSSRPWNATEEARQYFEEAQWAWRWRALREAQQASEAAWALGKRDLQCALVRLRSRLPDIGAGSGPLKKASAGFGPGTEPLKEREIRRIRATHAGAVFRWKNNTLEWAALSQPPAGRDLDRALRALELYYDFCRTSPEAEVKILSRGPGWNDWHNSDWYQLGIDTLVAASQVLQQFNLVPEAQPPVAEKLAQVRALARQVSGILAQSPSVHEGYFVGSRIATHDELAHTMQENPNIFRTKLTWGCFWQETPEAALALYRELMSSPVFCYLHTDFWQREVHLPRLAAWTPADQQRLPQVWADFLAELNQSTNLLWRMETKALMRADATDPAKADALSRELLGLIRDNRAELVANNVELFYLGWGLGMSPELDALDREYWDKTIPAQRTLGEFAKQKEYLARFTPYDFQAFCQLFSSRNYTKSQAAELLPLLEAYRSNLVAQANATTRFKAESDARWVDLFVEKGLRDILNPPPPTLTTLSAGAAAPPPPRPTAATSVVVPKPDAPTNVLIVRQFLPLPKAQLPTTNLSAVKIFEHRVREQALLLDLRYHEAWWERSKTALQQRTVYGEAAAIWRSNLWEVIPYPHAEEEFSPDFLGASFGTAGATLYFEWCQDGLYVSDRDAIRRYDLQTRRWEKLPFPGQSRAQLFAVNGRLYAASAESIWEILNQGQSTRILASVRRRPAASVLDARDTLGQPMLFAGPGGALRLALGGAVFSWNGADWTSLLTITNSHVPEIFGQTAFFRAPLDRRWVEFWRLPADQPNPQLCWREEDRVPPGIFRASPPAPATRLAAPLWKGPRGLALAQAPAASDGTNFYFFQDRTESTNSRTPKATILENRGRHADLVCLVPDSPEPLIVPLKFDPACGPAPSRQRQVIQWQSSIWMEDAPDCLFIGQADLPGVWAVAKPELARQVHQRRAAARERTAALLAQYDRNRDGSIGSDEKELAMSEPFFLEAELDTIDANGNGQLDAEELCYFDANKNGMLEANEEAGIRAVQKLLAVRSARAFDGNEDGQLDQVEFMAAFGNCSDTSSLVNFFNTNKAADGKLNAAQVEAFLQQQTQWSLRANSRPAGPPFGPGGRLFQSPTAGQMSFKEAVETYWKASPRTAGSRPLPAFPPERLPLPRGTLTAPQDLSR